MLTVTRNATGSTPEAHAPRCIHVGLGTQATLDNQERTIQPAEEQRDSVVVIAWAHENDLSPLPSGLRRFTAEQIREALRERPPRQQKGSCDLSGRISTREGVDSVV